MFTVNQMFPGIWHIFEKMGVGFTLIEGNDRAILFDAGYGIGEIKSLVGKLTGKPLTVFLSHGHHDHVLGARQFGSAFLCREDAAEFRLRTGEEQIRKVMAQAREQGIDVPDDYDSIAGITPETIRFTELAGPFEVRHEELGNLEVELFRVPGHTPGSIVLFIPEYDLLLTGDDWNPCTWMWFPTSDAANLWRDRMKKLTDVIETKSKKEIRHVICSHQPMLREAHELKDFLDYMSDERMINSPAVDMGAPINTHEVRNDRKGWQLIFDYDKISKVSRIPTD